MIGLAADLFTNEFQKIILEEADDHGRVFSKEELLTQLNEGLAECETESDIARESVESDFDKKILMVVEAGALETLGIGRDSKWWMGENEGPRDPEEVETYHAIQRQWIEAAGKCHVIRMPLILGLIW